MRFKRSIPTSLRGDFETRRLRSVRSALSGMGAVVGIGGRIDPSRCNGAVGAMATWALHGTFGAFGNDVMPGTGILVGNEVSGGGRRMCGRMVAKVLKAAWTKNGMDHNSSNH